MPTVFFLFIAATGCSLRFDFINCGFLFMAATGFSLRFDICFANGGFLFIVATGCSPFSTLCQRCLLFTAATGGYSGPFFSISISFATSAVHFVSMLSVDIMQMGQFSAWFNLQAVCHHLFNFMVLITHGADLDSRLSYFSIKAMIICTSKLLMFFVRCYF
jgi:hypothetical protein